MFCQPIIISIISAFIKDLAQIIPVILNLLFLTSPIMYPKEALGNLDFIPRFNLLYFYLDPLRNTFINGEINYLNNLILLIISIIFLIISFKIVIKNKFKIIELVAE